MFRWDLLMRFTRVCRILSAKVRLIISKVTNKYEQIVLEQTGFCNFKMTLSLSVSVCLSVGSGLPQYLVPEAEDTDYSEGKEESGETGVEEVDTH